MKRAKKLIWLLVTAAVFAAAPLTAMALPAGGYVPTAATWYYQDSSTKKWVKDYKVSFSYKKDGRLTKITNKYQGTTASTAYTWKGNYITKINYKNSENMLSSTTYKYKNKKLISYQYNGNKGANLAYKYKWKGKTGTYTQTGEGGSSTYKLTINAKGQLVKETCKDNDGFETTSIYKYYGNGNLKSSTIKGKGFDSSFTRVKKFNQKGYITLESLTSRSNIDKTTYKYKTQKGKIREVVFTNTFKEGEYSYEASRKLVFTKWKKVSHVRNCDAWGNTIPIW